VGHNISAAMSTSAPPVDRARPVDNPPGERRHRALNRTVVIASVLAPFGWFLVRSLGGRIDAVAVALPVIGVSSALVLGAIAAMRRRGWPATLGMSILVVSVLATMEPRLPEAMPSPEPEVVIAFANLYRENPSERMARADLLEREADVVAAVEVPDQQFSNRLAKTAPDLQYGLEHGWGAVWSRWELEEPVEFEWTHASVARAIVRHPLSPFVLYLVYAENPLGTASFDDQRTVIERLVSMISAEHLPVVLVGDLNTSDRTSGYRLLDASLRDVMRADTLAGSTYISDAWRSLFLRIDHMFVSPDWCGSHPATFAVAGSDHQGIEAAVGPCASPS
jgi:endonuclease/exonuclease/phosphatase (EEP) superfamily protein YafD